MDLDRLVADEYEEQYFDFSSTNFYNDLRELIDEWVKTAITEMETEFLQYCSDKNNGIPIQEETAALLKCYRKKADDVLEELLPDIRQFFEIPKNVLLEEDCFQTNQCSDEELEKLVDEVNDLEKEFKQLKLFELLCNEELRCLQKLKPVGRMLDDVADEMKKIKQDKIHAKQLKKLQKVEAASEEYLKYFQESMPGWVNKMQLCPIEFKKK